MMTARGSGATRRKPRSGNICRVISAVSNRNYQRRVMMSEARESVKHIYSARPLERAGEISIRIDVRVDASQYCFER